MGDVKLNSSGGGSVTLTPPSTASNLTVTLPSASGTLATTSGTGSVFTNPTINGFTGDTSVVNIGSGQFYKDTSGNVGIGTSSPTGKLQVKSANPQVWMEDSAAGTNGKFTAIGTSNGVMTFSRYLDNGSLVAQYMTLDASGNLGLGVTPSGWANAKAYQVGGYAAYAQRTTGTSDLSVSWNATITSGTSSGLGYVYRNTGDLASAYEQNGQHRWYTAPSGTAGNAISFTQAMTLDASGSLSVGTTTAYNINDNGIILSPGAGTTIVVKHINGTASGVYYHLFMYNGAVIGSITQNGTTNVLYNTSSDQRLKTNITPAGSAIQSILDFPVDQFDWIESGEHQDFGAVAQKAINFIPEMVSVPADEDEMWGIDWSKAVPRLIKTIQELSAKNSELESRLAALEGK